MGFSITGLAKVVIPLVRKYAGQAGLVLLILVFITGMYFHWKNKIFDEGYQKAVNEYTKRDAETYKKAEKLLIIKKAEVEEDKREERERLLNATKIYAEHWDKLRSNPIVIDRVRVRSEKASCGGNPVQGRSKDGRGAPQGDTGFSTAELPEENTRKFDAVIDDIEKMQLECEKLLNERK